MVCACSSLNMEYGWNHIRCSAHTLQLCIRDGEKEVPEVKEAIDAARHLVQHFRRSEKSMSTLRQRHLQMHSESDSSSLEMMIDVSTRWNSTYMMIENLLKHQWPIRAVLSDPRAMSLKTASAITFKDSSWDILKEVAALLKPFKDASDFLEGQEYVSMASLVPMIKGLSKKCESQQDLSTSAAKAYNDVIKQSIGKRFESVLSSVLSVQACHKATWLHPSYKGGYFPKPFAVLVKAAIESEGEDILELEKKEKSPAHGHTPALAAEQTSTLKFLFDIGKENGSSSEGESENLIGEEISWYLKEKSTTDDVLLWWRAKQSNAPILSKLAAKYLAIPATSALAERSFSSAGNTVSQLRSRLTGKHVNELNFLYQNRSLLQ